MVIFWFIFFLTPIEVIPLKDIKPTFEKIRQNAKNTLFCVGLTERRENLSWMIEFIGIGQNPRKSSIFYKKFIIYKLSFFIPIE
jgi:hypothetical protein